MLKNLTVALLILVLGVFAYVGYNGYSARHHLTSDEVYNGAGLPASSPDAKAASRAAAFPATSPTGADIAETPNGAPEVTAGGAAAAGSMVPPAADTIHPNPPNGMTFGGAGHFQLYRQGNLTWRLNTDTGETCVIFATEEEWRKPQVSRAGCRGR